MQAFPKVNFRYFVPPSQYLPGNGLGMLDFSNDTSTWPMQMIGRQDGANALQSGEGFLFNKMKDWNESADLQQQFPNVGDYVHHVNQIQIQKLKREKMQAEADKVEMTISPKDSEVIEIPTVSGEMFLQK